MTTLRETLARVLRLATQTTMPMLSPGTFISSGGLTEDKARLAAAAVLRALATWEPSDVMWLNAQTHMNDWAHYGLNPKEAVSRILRAMAEEGT